MEGEMDSIVNSRQILLKLLIQPQHESIVRKQTTPDIESAHHFPFYCPVLLQLC